MKELNEDGLEVIDGKTVKVYETKFQGTIVLEPEDAAGVSSGDLVSFVVTARACPPKFGDIPPKKGGGIKRVNTFKLESLIPLDPDRATQVCDSLGIFVKGVNDPDSIIEVSFVPPAEEQELGFNPEDGVL